MAFQQPWLSGTFLMKSANPVERTSKEVMCVQMALGTQNARCRETVSVVPQNAKITT